MKMFILFLAVFFSGPIPGLAEDPCEGEGCVNVTVYLGTRWGSRVMMVPKFNSSLLPEEKKLHPHQRPVPPGDVFEVDLSEEESSSGDISPTTNISTGTPYTRKRLGNETIHNKRTNDNILIDEFGRFSLYLSWKKYTGDDVKQVLMSLPQSDRSRIYKLVLIGNQIFQLPVLMFPVEFEYSLQELEISFNLFIPSFLSSYSRFELSRLSHLKILNLTRCFLTSITMPSLPSLEVLDLSFNQLTSLPSSLERLENLSRLVLRGNRITRIADPQLSVLTKLWMLDLGDNGLREMEGEPLENLRSLVVVKLDNNNLKSLPRLDSEANKFVSIANNTLECTCDLMFWLVGSNRQIEDGYYERCQDGNGSVALLELKLWPKEHTNLCEVTSAWASLNLWSWRNSDLCKVLGVTLVAVVMLLLLKRWNKNKADFPYSALDDHKISAVSGRIYTFSGPGPVPSGKPVPELETV